MHIANVIALHTSSEKHVTSGSFESRQGSGNPVINAVCFVVFLYLTNFYKKKISDLKTCDVKLFLRMIRLF